MVFYYQYLGYCNIGAILFCDWLFFDIITWTSLNRLCYHSQTKITLSYCVQCVNADLFYLIFLSNLYKPNLHYYSNYYIEMIIDYYTGMAIECYDDMNYDYF